MVALATFLTVHRASGSYGVAGLAVAAFSLGSGALAPLRGRLLDRRGARPWLIVFAAGYAAALSAVAVLARTEAPTWVLIALVAASGASAPPLIASLRGLWPSVVAEPLVRRGYALTSVIGDIGMVAAPAVAGLLFVVVPWLPLVLCAAGAVTAAVVVARLVPRRSPAEPAAAGGGPLLRRGFVVLLTVETALGVALGLVDVAVPTAASTWGAATYAGLLLAAFAFGSVLGGIWFGGRRFGAPPERRYLFATLLLALALLPPALATGPVALAPLLVLAGFAYGPATISLFEALDAVTTSRATEAFTWITTSAAAGAAVGSAAGGWTTTRVGLWAAFVAASAVLVTAAAFALGWNARASA